MFRVFLTKISLNNSVFLSLMKYNMRLQSICLIFCFLINISFLMGQHAQTQLSAPKKLDSLLKKKNSTRPFEYGQKTIYNTGFLRKF